MPMLIRGIPQENSERALWSVGKGSSDPLGFRLREKVKRPEEKRVERPEELRKRVERPQELRKRVERPSLLAKGGDLQLKPLPFSSVSSVPSQPPIY